MTLAEFFTLLVLVFIVAAILLLFSAPLWSFHLALYYAAVCFLTAFVSLLLSFGAVR